MQKETQQSGEPTPAELAAARRETAEARRTRSEPVDPADVYDGEEETVTMILPRACRVLTSDRKKLIKFPAGTQEVPLSLADHPYLKANGAVRYVPKLAKSEPAEPSTPAGQIPAKGAGKKPGKAFVQG